MFEDSMVVFSPEFPCGHFGALRGFSNKLREIKAKQECKVVEPKHPDKCPFGVWHVENVLDFAQTAEGLKDGPCF